MSFTLHAELPSGRGAPIKIGDGNLDQPLALPGTGYAEVTEQFLADLLVPQLMTPE